MFPTMVAAELRKVLSRASGQAGLAVAALVAVGAVIALRQALDMTDASVNGQMVADIVAPEADRALRWALGARNFFVLPLILLMVTAQLMAGELADRTLRAALVRPVSRGAVLAAKAAAAAIYSAMTLLITGGIAAALGAALFQVEDPLGPVVMGYGVSFLSDLGLIAVGLLLSVLMRSVVGVVVGTALFLMGDMAIRGALKLAGIFGAEGAGRLEPFLPGNALAAWEGYDGAAWDPQAFIGLAVLILGCAALAWLRFERADVV